MRRQRRTWEWCEKADVVRRIREGERPAHVADELSVSRTCIYNWLRDAEKPLEAKIRNAQFRLATIRDELERLEDARTLLKGD